MPKSLLDAVKRRCGRSPSAGHTLSPGRRTAVNDARFMLVLWVILALSPQPITEQFGEFYRAVSGVCLPPADFGHNVA